MHASTYTHIQQCVTACNAMFMIKYHVSESWFAEMNTVEPHLTDTPQKRTPTI